MFSSIVVALGYPTIYGLLSVLALYLFYKMTNKEAEDVMNKIPGPKSKYPLIGNIDLFRIKGVPLNQCILRIIKALVTVYEKYGICKFRLGPKYLVIVFKANTINAILTSNSNIDKSVEYRFLWPWLGLGLLTSTGSLWKSRRRMLTPAFHFKILEDFTPVMNEQSNILVNNLRNACNKPFIDIREPIVQCTLDVICETAMGVSIGAQVGNNKEYVNAIHNLGETLIKRIFSPWLWPNFIFFLTPLGKEFKSELNILHSMTRRVIKERKDNILSKKSETDEETIEANDDSNIYVSNKNRKRLAFLDLLLDYHIQNNALTLEEIREEVDTFMFEGHDTTSVSLSWTLYLLGLYPEIQLRIQEELDAVFGDERDRDITFDDMKHMEYLECVIKESLRLFPSVPFIGREMNEDVKVGEYVIPKGTNVFMLIESLHLDKEIYPDPIHFKPERFLDNNTSNINAYTYVPFSAGPRSCIGKRFALTEEKVILAKIFLNFNVKSLDPRDKIITSAEMVYRAKTPLRVQVVPRNEFKI